MPGTLPPTVEAELSHIAERMAAILEAIPPAEALSAFLAFSEQISLHRDAIRMQPRVRNNDPSDIGAPPDAPQPVAVPPEVIAEANRTFDEAEIADALREIRGGGGFQLQDFFPDLEKLAHALGGSTRV